MISNDAEIKDRILNKLLEDKDHVLDSTDFGAPIPEADEFPEIETEKELIAFLEEIEDDGLIGLDFSQDGFHTWILPKGIKFLKEGGYSSRLESIKKHIEVERKKEKKITRRELATISIAIAALLWQIIESVIRLATKQP